MCRTPDWAAQDLAASRAKRIDELLFVPQRGRSQTYYHIEVPSASKFFRVGWAEYVFLSLLDGTNTFVQAVTRLVRVLGPNALSQTQAMRVYTWALENGLIRLCEGDGVAGPPPKSAGPNWTATLAKWNPLWLKLPLGNPDRLLDAAFPWVGWLFSPRATFLSFLLCAVAGLAVAAQWGRFLDSAETVLSADNWLWLGLAWIVLKVCHESAHGFVAKRYRGEVRETGLILAFLAPTAYVDVTSCWRFSSKWQRIHVAAAGMQMEMILASLAACCWSFVTDEVWSHALHNVVLMASVTTVLFNANPLLRLDGYYILSDLLELPNLSTAGDRAWRSLVQRFFWGTKVERVELLGWRRWFVPAYGIASFAWRVIVTASLLVAASALGAGWGLLLCLGAGAAWFGEPLWRLAQMVQRAYWETQLALARASALSIAGVLCLLAAWTWLPWPGIASAPGIVEYRRDGLVRSRTDGFVASIQVTDGQLVQPGDVLLELRNEELTHERSAVASELQQLGVRRRVAQDQRDTGELQVIERYMAAMQQRLGELERRCEALRVKAPISGRVVARNLSARLETYVHEGDELLAIGHDDRKEVVISLAQEQVEPARRRLGEPVPVRIGLRGRTFGVLERVEPRATRELPHAALGAHFAGPLAVVAPGPEEHDSGVRLVEPRFRAVVSLSADDARRLACGEPGHLMLGGHETPFGQRLWWLCTRWVQQQWEAARS